jgi:uncharacterized membrane protein YhaH (DUF805 family)
MSFGQAITQFWTNYSRFSGRTRRSGYWWATLFLVLASILWWAVDLVVFRGLWPEQLLEQGFGPFSILWIAATFVPALSLGVRRLHDTGKSGWWVLIGLVPIAGAIVLLVFYVTDSQPGENAYGPNPKEAPQMMTGGED